jgi:hypothetical protein
VRHELLESREMAVALQRSATDVYEQTKVWQRSHQVSAQDTPAVRRSYVSPAAATASVQEVLELLATLCNFSGRAGRLSSGQGGAGLGVLDQIAGVREQLVIKHAERCEGIMTAVREELRALVAVCRSIDATLDTAHEQYYRLLDSAAGTDTCAATQVACQRTETDPSAADYMQWMLEVQRTYRQECNLNEQLVEQLVDYDDGAQIAAVRQAWQAQPFCSRRAAVGPEGAVTISARVLHSLAEAERQQAAAASSAATAHTGH